MHPEILRQNPLERFLNCLAPKIENYLKERIWTSLLQSLDQGNIYTFNKYYIGRSLRWILDATEPKLIGVMEN